nr:hypothetical protein [Williamsia limnetica]
MNKQLVALSLVGFLRFVSAVRRDIYLRGLLAEDLGHQGAPDKAATGQFLNAGLDGFERLEDRGSVVMLCELGPACSRDRRMQSWDIDLRWLGGGQVRRRSVLSGCVVEVATVRERTFEYLDLGECHSLDPPIGQLVTDDVALNHVGVHRERHSVLSTEVHAVNVSGADLSAFGAFSCHRGGLQFWHT